MEKIAEFQGDSRSITSVLKVARFPRPAPTDLPPQTVKMSSPPCGSGWKFHVQVNALTMDYSRFVLSASIEVDLRAFRDPLQVTILWTKVEDGAPELIKTISVKPSAEHHGNTVTYLAKWFERNPDSHPCLVYFVVSTTSGGLYPMEASLSPLKCTILRSLDSGQVRLSDTRFYVYSRRLESGRLAHPLAVYANWDALMASARLRGDEAWFTFEKFCNECRLPVSGDLPTDVDMYDYEGDSDLPEDEDIDEACPSPAPSSSTTSEHDPNELTFSGTNYLVVSAAYVTWRALIFYLYTGNIRFRSRSVSTSTDDSVPLCSARSMYRLAHKLGLVSLEKLALSAIKERLTEFNIVRHLFSEFTSMHPAVQELEIEFLRSHHTAAVTRRLTEMVPLACTPEFSHCVGVLARVVEMLSKASERPAKRPRAD